MENALDDFEKVYNNFTTLTYVGVRQGLAALSHAIDDLEHEINECENVSVFLGLVNNVKDDLKDPKKLVY